MPMASEARGQTRVLARGYSVPDVQVKADVCEECAEVIRVAVELVSIREGWKMSMESRMRECNAARAFLGNAPLTDERLKELAKMAADMASEMAHSPESMLAVMMGALGFKDTISRQMDEIQRLRAVIRKETGFAKEEECPLCWAKKDRLRQGIYPGNS